MRTHFGIRVWEANHDAVGMLLAILGYPALREQPKLKTLGELHQYLVDKHGDENDDEEDATEDPAREA